MVIDALERVTCRERLVVAGHGHGSGHVEQVWQHERVERDDAVDVLVRSELVKNFQQARRRGEIGRPVRITEVPGNPAVHADRQRRIDVGPVHLVDERGVFRVDQVHMPVIDAHNTHGADEAAACPQVLAVLGHHQVIAGTVGAERRGQDRQRVEQWRHPW